MSDAGVGAQKLHAALTALQAGHGEGAQREAMAALETFTAVNDRTGAAAAHQVLAIVAVGEGRLEDACAHVDSAIPLRESTGDWEGVSSLWQERMELCLRNGDVPGARASAERQVEASTRTTDKEGKAHALHQLAQLLLQTGDDGRAEAMVNDAIWQLDGPQFARARSAMHLLYANIWLSRGDTERAIGQARTGLEQARVAKSRPAEVDAIQQCGVIHATAGEYAPAQKALNEALVGRELMKDGEGKAQVLKELGGVELARGDVDAALGHFGYAARCLREVGNFVGEVTMLQLLQSSGEANERNDVAAQAAHDIIEAVRKTGDREAEAGAHFSLATRLAGQADLEGAIKHFNIATEIQEVLGLPHEAAVSRGMMGQVLVAAGRKEEGMVALKASLERLDALGSEAAAVVREVLAEVSK